MDGELPANGGDAVFQHLAVCRECQSYLSRYSQIRSAIREERIAIPASLDEKVLGRSEETGRKEQSVWRSRVNIPLPVAAAAVICLAALTAFALLREREPEPQQAVTGNLVDAGRTEYLYLLPAVQVVGNDQIEQSSESIEQ
jgi:anti-sigma factor RsiW